VADLEMNEEIHSAEPLAEDMRGEDMRGEDMMSQSDLDALIASSQESSAEESLSEEQEMPHSSPAGLVDFPEFESPRAAPESFSSNPGSDGLNRVRDIPLEVTVELGRTRLLIRDILDLSPGSIIELDKLAGEPVDLFANGMLVARGEVIVIDDNFGVRVTEIITAAERKNSEKDLHAFAS